MDKISIVVAVYNAEKYLKKCIESLLNQTYDNFEIILVNDFSTDNSLEICIQYSHLYSNILTFSNEINYGVSATRNRGIDISSGEYICFVDSDDYVEPDYLEKLYGYYRKYNTIPICGFLFHDEYNHCEPVSYSWSGGNELVSLGEAFKLYDELYLTALWNKLFDTNLIKLHNIRFDENLSRGEDLRFTINYLDRLNMTCVFAFTDTLYHYNKLTNTSLMSNIDIETINNSIENLHLIGDIVKKFDKDINKTYLTKLKKLKENYVYWIIHKNEFKDKDKFNLIVSFMPDFTKKEFYRAKFMVFKEKIFRLFHK